MDKQSARIAISCQDVWQVYGTDAKEQLARALSETSGCVSKTAQLLRERGLFPAVQKVSFSVNEGEVFVIMGLSGSGKSTLIRTIARLIEGTAGSILIDNENILAASKSRLIELRRNKLGMVFQHFGLFPHMTVLENVAFPLKMQGKTPRVRHTRALEVLQLVGLGQRQTSYPHELSGGQRQRVGIARALAVNPDVLFLDEPYSALDPLIRRQLQDEFLKLQAGLKKTSIFITHDITEALKLADRIAIMRDGIIVQIGTPDEIIVNPADDYVAEFTRDVPKGRYAHVSSMMVLPDTLPNMPDDPKINLDMTINDALASCMELYQPVPVWDNQQNMAGIVHPSQLASALQVEC